MRLKFFLSVAVISLIHLSCIQDPEDNDTLIRATPFSNKEVILDSSFIKHREQLNINYLKSLDPDRLLHNFRVNAGLPSDAEPLDGWEAPYIGLRGHFVGHYLSASSMIVEKYNDEQLGESINYLINQLFLCQNELGNGYLSAFPEKEFETLEKHFGGVWAPYYTFHKIMQGLLDVYIRLDNEKAYLMLLDMADYVAMRMENLSEDTIEKMLYTAHANPANESGAMNEILYKIYRISGDQRHLKLAQLFDRSWFFNPLQENKDILSGLHSNTHIALVNGFAERYRITGERRYYEAVSNFWKMLQDHHVYANGSSSGPRPNVTTRTSLTAEHWGVPNHLSNTFTGEISESCVTYNTQKLTSFLFSVTADPMYASVYMNTFYNATLPVQSNSTGMVVYHLPLGSPRKKSFLKENDYKCCNGSSIEAFAQLNRGIYYHDHENLWVNLFIPSTVNWTEKSLSLKQSGDLLKEKKLQFEISAAEVTNFTLNLLVPKGVNVASLSINGEQQKIKVISNSYISLNRDWHNDDIITVAFEYDFYFKSTSDNPNVAAVFYGPILLAFESKSEIILKGDLEELPEHFTVNSDFVSYQLVNDNKKYILRPFYQIENQSYGVYATLRNY